MPLYDYECLSCGHVFELRQSFHADPLDVCPRCEGTSKRKFHPVPIIYKGSGFYTTDYKQTNRSGISSDEDKSGTKKEESAATTGGSSGTKDKGEPTKERSEASKKEE